MKKLITLLLLFNVYLTSVQAQEYLEDFKEASLILAQQFHHKNQKLKAVTLLTFCLELDEQNNQARKLIDQINSDQKVRLYRRLPDEGRDFSKYINRVLKENPDMSSAKIKYLAYIAKVLDHRSPTAHISDDDAYFEVFKKHFPEYEPTSFEKKKMLGDIVDTDLVRRMQGKKPFEIAKNVTIEDFTYNPQKLLTTINEINKRLVPFDTEMVIRTKWLPYDDITLIKGAKAFIGPDLDVAHKVIHFKKASIYDILKYIEHTLALTFIQENNQIFIKEGIEGQQGRPELFRTTDKLISDIKQSTIKARTKYNLKPIQLKGYITQLKAGSSKLLVEINKHFVVEIDNRLLKDDTIQLMSDYLEKQKINPDEASKMLKVSLRGVIKIRTITRTDIIKCTSIIAEDQPHFYLKY